MGFFCCLGWWPRPRAEHQVLPFQVQGISGADLSTGARRFPAGLTGCRNGHCPTTLPPPANVGMTRLEELTLREGRQCFLSSKPREGSSERIIHKDGDLCKWGDGHSVSSGHSLPRRLADLFLPSPKRQKWNEREEKWREAVSTPYLIRVRDSLYLPT